MAPAAWAETELADNETYSMPIENVSQTPMDQEIPEDDDTESESSEEEEGTLRIVVTAEKRPDDLQNVPVSLTVLTEDELEDSQIRTFQEIARNTPNFYFNPVNSAGSYFSFYSIRGIGNANFINRDAVGFYVDDVPYDYGGFLDFDLTDLAQVEILRGPQNTLYGRSSAAGVVNVTTRPPSEELEVRAIAGYGNENTRDVQLSVSDTLIPDTLAFRLSGSYSAHDGFYENTFLDDGSVGEESSLSGRARVVWTPSPEWDISLTATASSDDDGAPIFVPFNSSTPFTIDHDFDGFYESNSNAQAVRIAYKTPQLEATSITSRRYSFQDSQLDADATSVDLLRRLASFDATVWSQELRVQSPTTAGPFDWLLGGYYESNQFDAEGTGLVLSQLAATQFGLPFAGFNRTDYELDRETYAVFGQVKYQPVEPLTLTAGLRYEAATSRLSRQRTFEVTDSPVVVPIAQPISENQNDGELLPRLAVDYRINPNLLAYASVTRGYRPGGLNPTAEQNSILDYQEETSWNYELGLKTSWLDNRLTANLALFTNQVENYQLLLRSFDAVSSDIINADAQISGLEFELRATPLDGLDVTAGFGYVDARFDNARNPFTDESFDGNRLPYAPKYNYNLAAQNRSSEGFFGRLEWQGYGSSFFDDAYRLQQDAFGLVNAQLGYEWDNTGIYIFANNIFDSRYITASLTAAGQDLASFGDPFTLGVQVRSRF